MTRRKQKIEWIPDEKHNYGIIRFPDGREVFMQGENFEELDVQFDECKSEEMQQELLAQYGHIAVWPEDQDES